MNRRTGSRLPVPSIITVREGEGVGGSDRITVIWPDNAIEQQWLQVTLKATLNTGLEVAEVHYWGNAIGESGDSPTYTFVNATDEIGARNNPHGRFTLASVYDQFDYNRDRFVNATDELISRNHPAGRFNSLQLFVAPMFMAPDGSSVGAGEAGILFSPSNSDKSSGSQLNGSVLRRSLFEWECVEWECVEWECVEWECVEWECVEWECVEWECVEWE